MSERKQTKTSLEQTTIIQNTIPRFQDVPNDHENISKQISTKQRQVRSSAERSVEGAEARDAALAAPSAVLVDDVVIEAQTLTKRPMSSKTSEAKQLTFCLVKKELCI